MEHIQGQSRDQLILFPESIDEYVSADNMVRVIEAFVDDLDLAALGYHRVIPKATGRPPYHPGDLLKLFLYGYLNRIRSSRRLERETHRNVEVMWLIRRLRPDFKTLADFRRIHAVALKDTFHALVRLCRELDTYGFETFALDGSPFRAVNNSDRIHSAPKLEREQREIEKSIEDYLEDLERNDQLEEERMRQHPPPDAEKIRKIIEHLKQRKKAIQSTLNDLSSTQTRHRCLTDSDARLMRQRNKPTQVGYNAQILVDNRHSSVCTTRSPMRRRTKNCWRR